MFVLMCEIALKDTFTPRKLFEHMTVLSFCGEILKFKILKRVLQSIYFTLRHCKFRQAKRLMPPVCVSLSLLKFGQNEIHNF